MSATNDGGPAFPVAIMARQADGQPLTGYDFGVGGMSLRDWFAGMALQGYCARPDLEKECQQGFALAAYDQADAMLAARERKEEA